MAYALESLIQILEHDPYHLDLHLEIQNQIKSLLQKSRDLRDLVHHISFPNVMPENLARRVRDVAHKIEDVIEINITNQIRSDVDSEIELACVIEEFDSIKEELMMLTIVDENTSDPLPDRLQEVDPSRRDDIVVGFGQYQYQLDDIFRKESPELRIISIVGKGGLGKTTLTQKICSSKFINKLFARHVWVTISQEYNMQTTLLSLLGSLRKIENYMRILKVSQLGELVHNTLKGSKYLLVLDDIWDIRAWNQLRKFFPDDGNGSGIILTTRNSAVAHYASSFIIELGPLTECESLRLLRKKVHRYRDDLYHPGYGYVAAYIARTCQGYPLAITLMAGLLTTSTNMGESWEYMFGAISKYVEVATKDDDINEVVLSLCYNHLPNWLKPCFLNIGAFPEDHEIRASKITKLWIAEGFIKSVVERNLEDSAEVYLKAIIDRNLVIVSQKEPNGKAKAFKVHDVVRDFCLKKSLEEKFLWSKEDLVGPNFLGEEHEIRRISARIPLKPSKNRQQLSLARSFLCIGPASLYLAPMFLCLRFLKILDVFQVEFYQFPTEILQMTLLKFLAFSCHSTLPSSISKLRNLQTLIMRRLPSFRALVLPSELWDLAQLRHVKSNETCVLYCPTDREFVLENLQTLSNVQTLGFTNEFLRTVPNLRKLGISCNTAMGTVIDLSCLDKLETLKCSSDWSLASHSFLSYLTFPSSLIKLTLSFCKIPKGFMRIIGSLPNLEEFKVLNSDFLDIDSTGRPKTPLWKTNEGEFVELLSLHMEDLNLVMWQVNETSFVNLQFLTVKSCSSMASGIPLGIGIKSKSMRIEVDKSCPSLLASALQMQEKYKVQVHISRNLS